MATVAIDRLVSAARREAIGIEPGSTTREALVERLAGARFVLIGEASHGTHEFYRERAELTKALIERGFGAVAVEADWPDAYRVNRFVRARRVSAGGARGIRADARHAARSLDGFERFPTWMWRNRDVLEFVAWLRHFNEAHPEPRRAGFYGLDLYSLQTSINEVIRYLDTVDPLAA